MRVTDFTRPTATWEKVGVNVANKSNIQAAIKESGMDWTVSLEPLFRVRKGAVEPYTQADLLRADANSAVRSDNNKELGVVGREYKALQNYEAWNFFQPVLDSGLATLETAGVLKDGAKTWILARLGKDDGDVITKYTNDRLIRYLLLYNSHNGTSSVKIGYTSTRVCCGNSLAVALKSKESKLLAVQHTKNVLVNMEMIKQSIDAVNQTFSANVELYKKLANAKGINKEKFNLYVRKVFEIPDSLADDEIHTKTKNKLSTLLENFETDATAANPSFWTAYNSVTNYLSNQASRSEDGRLDSLWFGQGAKINQRALEIAINMAV